MKKINLNNNVKKKGFTMFGEYCIDQKGQSCITYEGDQRLIKPKYVNFLNLGNKF